MTAMEPRDGRRADFWGMTTIASYQYGVDNMSFLRQSRAVDFSSRKAKIKKQDRVRAKPGLQCVGNIQTHEDRILKVWRRNR